MGKKILGILVSVFLLVPALALAQTASTTPAGRMGHRLFGGVHNGATATHTPPRRVYLNANATSTSASMVSGTVAAVSGESITLTGNSGISYTVDATNAKILRKFGAAMAITDIQTGDVLAVSGIVSGSNITAKIIRDNSQQQKNASFSGSVMAVNGNSFTLQTKNRGNQTVNPTAPQSLRKAGKHRSASAM